MSECSCALCSRARRSSSLQDVGSALLDFFTWLSLITRKDPAPCCCGATAECMEADGPSPFYVECSSWRTAPRDRACFQGPQRKTSSEAVRVWNDQMVPAAYRRLANGGG
jgi:hypothetical protein